MGGETKILKGGGGGGEGGGGGGGGGRQAESRSGHLKKGRGLEAPYELS